MLLKDSIDLLKDAQQIAEKIKSKPLNDIIVQLQQDVIAMGNETLELQEKYHKLKDKVLVPDNIYIDDNDFLCIKNDSRKYCPKCWNRYRKLSLMPTVGVSETVAMDYEKPYVFQCAGCGYVVRADQERFDKN